MVIRKEVQQFIKTNALASIGSDGLMGDKVLTISAGHGQGTTVTEGNVIASKKAIEMEDLMAGVKTSVDNAAVITAELAKFSYSMNNGNGALSRMISDQEFGNSLKATLSNLRNSSDEFAKFTYSMNNGKGALSKLMTDEKFGNTLDSTMSNLQASTKKLDQNMEAAQHNILLRGFFKKQEKAKAKKIADEKKAADLKLKNDLKKAKSSGVIQGADTLLIK
jgi:phospholipid/cholesterol/gamma-HCH transport system substrate-binding protein